MSTTDLFVELIVIGIGAAIWLTLLILSIFGYGWIPLDNASSLAALIPLLSVVYVLGIVVDRIADTIFDRVWNPSLLNKYYDDESKYFDDRRTLYVHPGRLSNLLEYGRSRLRICRGWTINAVLILLSLNVFVWTQVTNDNLQIKLSVAGSLVVGAFAYANWFAWRKLVLNNYRKVQSQAAFLRAMKSIAQEEAMVKDASDQT